MCKRVMFWLENSRLFSLPMTFMSWIVIFLYALKSGGNVINGIIALIGISFAHLATNLFDDYVDYKVLSKDEKFIKNTVKSKCAYIKNGDATLQELLLVVVIYCLIALITGIYLAFHSGIEVLYLAAIGGIITLSYAKLSSAGLSEFAVGTAFGPLLFEGVYFVMCGRFSLEVLILSIAVVVFTIGLLYIHTLLDYDGDVISGKKTLCIRLGSKKRALNGIYVLYGTGYLMCVVLTVISGYLLFLLPLITFWLVIFLYKSVEQYYKNEAAVLHWWNYPLDNIKKIKSEGTENFYIRLYLARNIMVWFSLLMIIAIFFK